MQNTELFTWFYGEFDESYSWDDLVFMPRFILERLRGAKEAEEEGEFHRILNVVTESNQVILQKIQALQNDNPTPAQPSSPSVPGSYVNPTPGSGGGDSISDYKQGFNLNINPKGIDVEE